MDETVLECELNVLFFGFLLIITIILLILIELLQFMGCYLRLISITLHPCGRDNQDI